MEVDSYPVQQPAIPTNYYPAETQPTKSIIRINNLHYNVENGDLEELGAQYGPVSNVRLFYDNTDRPTGEAEITFASKDHAIAAANDLDGVSFDGQVIEVKHYEVPLKKNGGGLTAKFGATVPPLLAGVPAVYSAPPLVPVAHPQNGVGRPHHQQQQQQQQQRPKQQQQQKQQSKKKDPPKQSVYLRLGAMPGAGVTKKSGNKKEADLQVSKKLAGRLGPKKVSVMARLGPAVGPAIAAEGTKSVGGAAAAGGKKKRVKANGKK
ncbi:hypothetical protein HDV05_000643 [Chytridiales sp. JEL 0842]|nr:hypothetical protein HDV05_000643 [Chytridiales sp. JEL 0842]